MGTKAFFVSYIEYISKIPLRSRGNLNRRFVKEYFENDDDESSESAVVWVEWMLKYRNSKNLDLASRDVLTRFALSLVVKFGHASCKKAKRIQHEMDKEKEENMEVDDDDEDDDKESVDSFESEADDVIIWQPQWVNFLNEFSNDSNAVIRMTTRKVKTMFIDWKEHKEAAKTFVKKIVENTV